MLEDDDKIFAFTRGKNYLIAANFSNEAVNLQIPSEYKIFLSTEKNSNDPNHLEPLEARIYKR